MATLNKKLAHGTLADAKATLYTTPASTQTIIKSLILCNKTATARTVDLYFGGRLVLKSYTISAYDTYILPKIDSIIDAAELIEGNASATTAIDYIICGKEVS